MRKKGIRFQLIIWYSCALFAATILVFAAFYFVTRQVLFTHTDQILTSHGDKVAEVMLRQSTDMRQAMQKEAFINEFNDLPGMFVVLINNQGEVLNSSYTINSGDQVFTRLYQETLQLQKPFFRDEQVGSVAMRFYTVPLNIQNQFAGAVMIGHPIDVIQKSLNTLLLVLVVTFLVLSIPTVGGGYFLANRAIRPISTMSSQLRRINSENLNLDEQVSNPQTGDEIEELAVTFNSLLERLRLTFNRERQFLGDVAHELKTPLSTLHNDIEVAISKERTKEEYKGVLKEAFIDTNRVISTLKNILDLAWSEADSGRMKPDEINLSELIEELKDVASKMATSKHITVEGVVEQNITILGKQDKLYRAMLNLIDNAIKYTPTPGKVTLSLHKKGSKAMIYVKDTGIGIAPVDLPHIFERFYRGSKADKVFGSGLGLAIVLGVIKAHRGTIEANSKIGKGTTITIALPLVKAFST